MNAKLVVVIGNTTKREVELQLPAVLGRSREADVTVAHPLISRRHCEIAENNGLLMLRDLASLNGTMIGGRRVELAPLLPEAEFTIGPLTFRVLYEYDGDLESIPEPRFVDEAQQEPAEAGLGDPEVEEEVPMFEVDEALPAELADVSDSGELATPDIMALADAEIEEILPAAPGPAEQGPQWPPLADDMLLEISATDALDDPLDVDSSLGSGGGHRAAVEKESPWAANSRAVEEPQHRPAASAAKVNPAPPEAISAEEVVKPPPKKKPPAANPPKRTEDSDDLDPEFGSFFEDLQ